MGVSAGPARVPATWAAQDWQQASPSCSVALRARGEAAMPQCHTRNASTCPPPPPHKTTLLCVASQEQAVPVHQQVAQGQRRAQLPGGWPVHVECRQLGRNWWAPARLLPAGSRIPCPPPPPHPASLPGPVRQLATMSCGLTCSAASRLHRQTLGCPPPSPAPLWPHGSQACTMPRPPPTRAAGPSPASSTWCAPTTRRSSRRWCVAVNGSSGEGRGMGWHGLAGLFLHALVRRRPCGC